MGRSVGQTALKAKQTQNVAGFAPFCALVMLPKLCRGFPANLCLDITINCLSLEACGMGNAAPCQQLSLREGWNDVILTLQQ